MLSHPIIVTKQRGVALITAMIMVSIVVSLAATIVYRQQIQIRLSSNISHLEQAYQYAYGMEDWAGTILQRSYEEHPDYDSLLDDWYNGGKDLVLPITGGLMQGKLIDLNSRININSLNRPFIQTELEQTNPPRTPAQQQAAQQQQDAEDEFNDVASITRQRLITLLSSIDPDQEMGPPESMVDIMKDWVDADEFNGNLRDVDNGTGSGAESPYYQSQQPAYYSANTEMVSITELRLLKGMTEKHFQQLKKSISALPIELDGNAIETKINVNTASQEVLQAIGFTPDEVEAIIQNRENEAFETFQAFEELSALGQFATPENNEGVNPNDLDVKSSHFLLIGIVEINNARLFINSVLERKDGKVSVIMRDFSNPETIKTAEN